MILEQLFLLFFIFSIAGWILEFLYRAVFTKKIVNPGFFKGPYLPVYGIGSLLLIFLSLILTNTDYFVKIPIYCIFVVILEYITGELLLNIFNKRYWDYTKNLFNLKGHICLKYFVLWSLLVVFFDFLIFPFVWQIVNKLEYLYIKAFDFSMVFILIIDLIYSIKVINNQVFVKLKTIISSYKAVLFVSDIFKNFKNTTIQLEFAPIKLYKLNKRNLFYNFDFRRKFSKLIKGYYEKI